MTGLTGSTCHFFFVCLCYCAFAQRSRAEHELSARGLGHRLHVELEMDHSDGGSDVNATIVSLTREFGSDPCIYDSHQQSAVFMVLKKDEAAALPAVLARRALTSTLSRDTLGAALL